MRVIDLDLRDVDVPLSDLGHQQAEATGRWFAALPEHERPEVLLASPLHPRQADRRGDLPGGRPRRRRQADDPRRAPARARVRRVRRPHHASASSQQYPKEAAHRAKMGKFYHRPPGGESWADVILRLRSALNTINLQYADKRVIVVAHQVVVLCMRYILEELTEEQILGIDQPGRDPQLRHRRLRLRPQRAGAVRAHAGAVEPRRADGGAGHAQDRRARHDDRIAMSAATRARPRRARPPSAARRSPAATRTATARS